eukprot:7192907-Ditylum_brightwellii.AAC.1
MTGHFGSYDMYWVIFNQGRNDEWLWSHSSTVHIGSTKVSNSAHFGHPWPSHMSKCSETD